MRRACPWTPGVCLMSLKILHCMREVQTLWTLHIYKNSQGRLLSEDTLIQVLSCSCRTLGALAEKCHAFAKALHYKELEYASSADTAVEALISINNQLRQPEAAIGILTLAQTQLHMELKVHLDMRMLLGNAILTAPASNNFGIPLEATDLSCRSPGMKSSTAGTKRWRHMSASTAMHMALPPMWTLLWAVCGEWPVSPTVHHPRHHPLSCTMLFLRC